MGPEQNSAVLENDATEEIEVRPDASAIVVAAGVTNDIVDSPMRVRKRNGDFEHVYLNKFAASYTNMTLPTITPG